MSQAINEQENGVLDQMSDIRHNGLKIQTTDMKAKTGQVMATPMGRQLKAQPFKTPFGKSSRKAFGNVSNVLRSETKPSVAAKTQSKGSETMIKASVTTNNDMKDTKVDTEVDTNCITTDAKFMDDIENMYPMGDELMSDVNDSITKGLFELNDSVVLAMDFDSDLIQCLAPKASNFDFNSLL